MLSHKADVPACYEMHVQISLSLCNQEQRRTVNWLYIVTYYNMTM